MRIALYQGKSWISRAIRFQTRSKYSHAAMLFDDGTVVEAWWNGVHHHDSLGEVHTLGTVIDIFDVEIPDGEACRDFLFFRVGASYDYYSIFRFLGRVPGDQDDQWFCSELVFAAVNAGGLKLLERIRAQDVSPALLSLSPHLRYNQTIVLS